MDPALLFIGINIAIWGFIISLKLDKIKEAIEKTIPKSSD